MKKPRFVLNTLRELEAKAVEFKAKGITNGNAINKVIRDVEKASYDSGFFDTGKVSELYLDHHGKPYKLQNSLNYREIFLGHLNM